MVTTYVSAGPLGAQTENEPSNVAPPAPRRLTGEAASKVAGLRQQIRRLDESGRFGEAIAPAREVLEVRTRVQGASHWETTGSQLFLDTLKQLASLPEEGQREIGLTYSESRRAIDLEKRESYPEAERIHRTVIEKNRRWLGEDHSMMATLYENLAHTLERQWRYTDALPLHRKALDIQRKALGEDHPDTARAYNGLARNLDEQARYAEALPLQQKALDIWRKARGEEHPDTAVAYNNLALNLFHQGRYADALPLYQKSLDIQRKVLGEDHPFTAVAYTNLACNLERQGRHADALPLQQKSLDICRKVRGEDHPDTATAYNNLAENLGNQRRHAEALPLLQKALDIWRKALGEEHRNTALAYNNLAINLGNQGRHAEALPLLQKALDINRKVLGEDHPDTAIAYSALASCLHVLGRAPEAITYWTAAAGSFERGRRALSSSGLGRSQAARIDPVLALAVALASQGQFQEAWRRWESSLGRGLLDDISARRLRPLTSAQRGQEVNLLGQIQNLDERISVLAAGRGRSGANDVRMNHLRQQRDTLQGELLELEQALEAQYGAMGGKQTTLEEIQATLPPDAALVGWVDLRNLDRSVSLHWACLVRAQGDPIWVQVPGSGTNGAWAEQDDRRPEQLRTALLRKDPGWRELAAQVARQRLEPLKQRLNHLRRLIVLPSIDLAGIPAEALLEAWGDGPKLVVSYAPSGTMLSQLTRTSASPLAAAKLLAVGDPLYDSPSVTQELASRPSEGVQIVLVEYPRGRRDGLRPGDVLLTYDGQEIVDSKQFYQVFGETKAKLKTAQPGKSFKPAVTVLRAGNVQEFVLDPHFVNVIVRNWRGVSRPRTSMPRLLGTRLEVEAISALFPAAQATTFLGEQATESAVQRLAASGELARYRFLHFATHGSVNPVVAMSSALILGADEDNHPSSELSEGESDGRITAEQILNTWTLDADMVVFSACETGLGRQAKGEGYLGFAQALFIKGARSLVLSQWSVNDAATALLMARFYQNLLAKRPGLPQPMPRAEALDEAKTWLRNLTRDQARTELAALDRGFVRPLADAGGTKEGNAAPSLKPVDPRPFAHPFYWAGFILIGDPR
jgi:CHAT domain-containing protein